MTAMTLLCQLLLILAFACLALAMDRHQHTLFGQELPPRRNWQLRALGWIFLLLSLAATLFSASGPRQWVTWCWQLSLSAGLVALALVAVERWRIRR